MKSIVKYVRSKTTSADEEDDKSYLNLDDSNVSNDIALEQNNDYCSFPKKNENFQDNDLNEILSSK